MSISPIAIITDSTNDLPDELIAEHQITVVPLTIVWDNNQYLDGVDLKREQFYSQLSTSSTSPSTLPPRAQSYMDAFNSVTSRGASKIVVITMSSALGGSYESARAAAMGYKSPVTVLDSRSTSMGLGFQVLEMARAAQAGGGIPDVIQAASRIRDVIQMRVALDTLDYVVRGGKVSGIAKRIGNLLKLKPQLKFNTDTGSADPGDLTTSREKALDALFNSFCKSLDKSKPTHVAVRYNLADSEALQLAERVKQELNPVELSVGIMSPILGTHAGPYAMSLSGYSETW
jgi:DegV family protein with EDD domain